MARTRSISRIGTSIVAVAACAGLLASCSSSGAKPAGSTSGSGAGSGSASGSAGGSGNVVDVKNFSFVPGNLTITKGTTVTWKFDDQADHNVTASNNAFKSTNLHTGGTYSFTFNTAGTYSYICTIHQYMKGAVTVK